MSCDHVLAAHFGMEELQGDQTIVGVLQILCRSLLISCRSPMFRRHAAVFRRELEEETRSPGMIG